MASFRNRLFAIIALLGFLTAAFGPLVPDSAAAAQPCAMMMADGSGGADHDGMGKADMAGCHVGMSCIITIALPMSFVPAATSLKWQPVHYWAAADLRTGITVSPDPSPPKSRV